MAMAGGLRLPVSVANITVKDNVYRPTLFLITSTGSLTPFRFFSAAINFAYHTLTRDCVAVAKDDDSSTDGCHTSLPSSGPARKVLSGALQGMAVGDVSYKGKACYYSYFTAGVGGLYYEPALMAVLLFFFWP